jgi:RimJ/RimL family protein N-acetyltransferase
MKKPVNPGSRLPGAARGNSVDGYRAADEPARMTQPGRDPHPPAEPAAPTLTPRLALHLPRDTDLDELHELFADPQVWRDDPIARHRDREQTRTLIDRWQAGWRDNGAGMWVARSTEPATAHRLVGIGGAFVRQQVAWNLGFRLAREFWGHGYAQEIVRAGWAAARALRPALPMTAYLVEGNIRSQRATERAGLRRVWRGPDAGNPDPDAVRLLYADRDLPPATIQALTEV